jgi:GT2 family glycosyltransferase
MNDAAVSDASIVSVIIPVFNDQPGALNCLEALRAQSYPAEKTQVILVDNGSAPPLEIDQTYPFELHVERCLTPGSYAARNAGAGIATGDLIAFTDADCVPDKDWLRNGIAAIQSGRESCLAGGEVLISEPKIRTGVALYQYATGFQQRENIEAKGFSATANLFCSRDNFKRIGPFDERLLSGGDREWAWRARRTGIDITFVADAIVSTPPRTSLREATRQARRVAAGRYYLHVLELDWIGQPALHPHRGPIEALSWILRRSELSFFERLKVLGAASAIKTATFAERIRIRLGGLAERR